MSPLLTPWGEALDPDRVLQEYPRPQLVRGSCLNLNGRWEYAITPATATSAPARFDGEILVPFSPEAPLSGVNRTLLPDQALWYRRTLRLPSGFVAERVLLHFGAVDSQAEVWLDGVAVGGHRGGYLPFTIDLTGRVGERTDHELVVRVRDLTDTAWHSRGKQVLKPGGIWYTPQSGIWQTVWVESVPASWVHGLELVPDLEREELLVRVLPGGPPVPGRVHALAGGLEVAAADLVDGVATLALPGGRRWSPEDPFLYDLDLTYGRDRVASYAALRSVGIGPDRQGTTRLLLNGEPYLHAGLLDQGYWPDGLYTAPSDAALVHDIETAKQLGFTMLRKHIKIEPLRWYHHCDRQGMLVWQDLVNGGRRYHPAVVTAPVLTPLRLKDSRYRLFGRRDAEGREEFLAEADATVALLRNSPSVVAWVPFNEGWGQFDAAAVTDRLRAADPTRIIDHASGWHDQGAGDVASRHVYFRRYRLSDSDRRDPRAAVLTEYGGYSHRVPGHTWSDTEFGYRRIPDRAAFASAFLRLQADQIGPAIRSGLAGFVYTQLADVEQETNGLMTYDRKELKLDADAVRASTDSLRATFAAATGSTPTPVPVTETELTEPVSLTLPDGRLNPKAVGFSRTPLVTTDGIGRGRVGAGRNKRWEYWAVTTPTHIVAVVVSDIDYAGVNSLWLLDRAAGVEVGQELITPFGAGVELPATLGAGPARLRSKKLRVDITEVDGGTRITATGQRVRLEVVAHRPQGHECLGVVVPWTDRLFQYTVKDVARPATGTLWLDGVAHHLPEGESWATLDHGRGRWPHRVAWNWGAGSGRSGGRVIGVQVGGKWTDGTGSVENSLLVDGRLHKLSQELVWDYDPSDWLAPWRVSGEGVDLRFVPEFDKVSATDLKVISSRTHQCFGTWSGRVRLGSGEDVEFDGIVGWAEEVHQRW